MVTLIFSPVWFYGIDSVFDIFFVVVSVLIAAFARKAYQMTREHKFLSLYWAFVFIVFSFLVKILTHSIIYFKYIDLSVMGIFSMLGEITFVFQVGYLFYRLFFLLALIILLALTLHITDARVIVMLQLLAITLALYSSSAPTLFHIGAAIFLLFICNNCRLNYRHRKTWPSRLVAWGFMMFLASQIMFAFVAWHNLAYVAGETLQLMGSIFLLASLSLVRK